MEEIVKNFDVDVIKFNNATMVCPIINDEPHVLAKSIIDSIGLSYENSLTNLRNVLITKIIKTMEVNKFSYKGIQKFLKNNRIGTLCHTHITTIGPVESGKDEITISLDQHQFHAIINTLAFAEEIREEALPHMSALSEEYLEMASENILIRKIINAAKESGLYCAVFPVEVDFTIRKSNFDEEYEDVENEANTSTLDKLIKSENKELTFKINK